MKRRRFIALVGCSAITWPLGPSAQQLQSALPRRIGVLALSECPAAFLRSDSPASRRLAELGWIEGRNFIVECVSTVGRVDQLPALARELVSRRLDILMAANSH